MRYLCIILILLIGQFVSGQSILSYKITDIKTGEELASKNENLYLVPASIYKVPITYLGYKTLGKDFRFSTEMSISGKIIEGHLMGDLIIMGGGDPTIHSKHFPGRQNDFLNWIYDYLKGKGIDCIEGDLIIDASGFGTATVAPTWPWYDIGNYYAAGAWSCNFSDNFYPITFQLSQNDRPPKLLTHSGPSSLKITSEVVTGAKGSGDQAYIYGGPFQYNKMVRGSLPPGAKTYTIKGALPEPPRSFGLAVKDYLESNGIQIGQVRVSYQAISVKREKQITHTSPDLKDIIEVILHKSDNLYCEAVFRQMADENDYQPALEILETIWRNEFGGSQSKGRLFDGCGLSPFNRLSCNQMVEILERICTESPAFLDLMADGKNTSLGPYLSVGKSKIKSGYMEGVRSYTGVINSRYAFCVIYNGPDHGSSSIKKDIGRILEVAINK